MCQMLSLLLAATMVPFQLQDHRIFVQAYVNAAGPFAMIVDTGSPGLAITPEVARRLKLGNKPAGYVLGAAGSAAAGSAKVADVRAGNVDFGGAQTEIIDLGP